MSVMAENNLLLPHILEETEILVVSPHILPITEGRLHFPHNPAMKGDGLNSPHILAVAQLIFHFPYTFIPYKVMKRIYLFPM
jgi:hypothetical protein